MSLLIKQSFMSCHNVEFQFLQLIYLYMYHNVPDIFPEEVSSPGTVDQVSKTVLGISNEELEVAKQFIGFSLIPFFVI